MLMITNEFGAVATSAAKTVDVRGRSVNPGERLNRYPWEKAVRQRNVVAALKGRSYPGPLSLSPVRLGRNRAQQAAVLMAMARHGAPEHKTVMSGVKDMITWMRAGNPAVDVRRITQDRLQRLASVDIDRIYVNKQTPADHIRAKVQAVTSAGLVILNPR